MVFTNGWDRQWPVQQRDNEDLLNENLARTKKSLFFFVLIRKMKILF